MRHRVSIRIGPRKGRPYFVLSKAGCSTCLELGPIQEHAPSHAEVKIELRLEYIAASLSST